ncbi:entry exclusion lipoprotein TrbK [Azoarcus sp. PA01]|nr:entry exclusion lipoprotein TrbK [Azoarcus sp. PA01]KON82566.1 entry exclusion lipoprotein TrbK [Azoarcus sp. PA01]
MNRNLTLTAAALMGALVTGCAPDASEEPKKEEMPVVNDENCKLENIKKIQDEKVRQAFADACARRGDFKSSSGKTY